MGKVKVDLSLVDLAALLLSLFSTTHFTVTSIISCFSFFCKKLSNLLIIVMSNKKSIKP
jgi:hypothetical protein